MPNASTPAASFHTRWTRVGGARGEAERSLLALCLDNWYPVYAYLRHLGLPPEQAQDAARNFFGRLLEAAPDDAVTAAFGRFRRYLQTQLQAFDPLRSSPAGANAPLSPLALEALEARQLRERAHTHTPEQALQRACALDLVARSLDQLRGEAAEAGRLALYEALETYLGLDPGPDALQAIAERLRLRPVFAQMALTRLRERFRELVDDALGDTVVDGDELDAERAALQSALSGLRR